MSKDDAQTPPGFAAPLPPPSPPRLPPSGKPTPAPTLAGTALNSTIQRLLDDDGSALALFGLDGAVHDLSRAMLRLLGVNSIADVGSGSLADGVL
jgi:hypothetical protein